MSQSPYHPTRLIGNIAAVVLLAIGAAYLFDRTARWLGWNTDLLCSAVNVIGPVTFSLGVIMCTFGFVIWAVSRFRSEAGIGLMIGGTILSFLPGVMPHYLGWTCLPASI